jgi:multiple sugar transport system ATP-binding protein
MACVALENLSKLFRVRPRENICAVNNLSLTIEDKELLVLVGPSGCGKSTTLRLIAGLEDLTSGTIRIDEQVMNGIEPKDRDIAMVFQNYALYPHMTVFDNMAFGLKLRKVARNEIEQRVRQAAQTLGLMSLLARKPSLLSGGERQRVALGRAMVRNPKAFLLDEPLSNLDAPLRGQMRAEIAKLHARLGATMVYVTHDQMEAMTLGDRIAVMKSGVIQQCGSPLSIYKSPANLFVAAFIGWPPMNFFTGGIVRRDGQIWFMGSAKFALSVEPARAPRLSDYADKSVILGLRPQDISVNASKLNAIPANVEVIEFLGAETFLSMKIEPHSFTVRAPAEAAFKIGETIPVSFDMQKARFFDPATELAIN